MNQEKFFIVLKWDRYDENWNEIAYFTKSEYAEEHIILLTKYERREMFKIIEEEFTK
jgi:hypothetical protein